MESVSLDQARKLVASHEVAVLDLRDDEGWLDGHIPGAYRADADDPDSALEGIPDDRKLLVVCEDGERSAAVAEKLEGRREAAALEGGMRAWLSKGLPAQPSEDYEPGPEEGAVEEGPEEGHDAPGGDEPAERG